MRKLPLLLGVAIRLALDCRRRLYDNLDFQTAGATSSDCSVYKTALSPLMTQSLLPKIGLTENGRPGIPCGFSGNAYLRKCPIRVEEAYSLGVDSIIQWACHGAGCGARKIVTFMVAKELDSKGWSKFGKVVATNARELTPCEWSSFTDLPNVEFVFGRHPRRSTKLRQTRLPSGC